jgi:hypothetical protein
MMLSTLQSNLQRAVSAASNGERSMTHRVALRLSRMIRLELTRAPVVEHTV